MEAVVTGGFKHGLDDEPSEIKALGGSISVLSVGGALAGTLGIGMLTGTAAWPLDSFAATVLYLCFFALEISIAEWLRRRVRTRRKA